MKNWEKLSESGQLYVQTEENKNISIHVKKGILGMLV